VLLAAEVHAESLQSCTCLWQSHPPSARDLEQALAEPLTSSGGLGRWLATTMLAQAVAHRQQGTHPGVRAGTGMGIGVDASSAAYSMPAFAADIFCPSSIPRAEVASTRCNAVTGFKMFKDNFTPGLGDVGQDSGGLFSIYLRSGLEVLREFTVRVQCLATSMRRRGPYPLRPTHILILENRVQELQPLASVAAAGLSGWIVLSRDLDGFGVVQRLEALRKVLYEICGLVTAIDTVWPMCDELCISLPCIWALQVAAGEARHSLQQLIIAFEGAGLSEVMLPPAYSHVVQSFGKGTTSVH